VEYFFDASSIGIPIIFVRIDSPSDLRCAQQKVPSHPCFLVKALSALFNCLSPQVKQPRANDNCKLVWVPPIQHYLSASCPSTSIIFAHTQVSTRTIILPCRLYEQVPTAYCILNAVCVPDASVDHLSCQMIYLKSASIQIRPVPCGFSSLEVRLAKSRGYLCVCESDC